MLRSLTGRQPQETQLYGGGAQSNVSQRLAAGSGSSSERSIKEKKMYGWTAYSLKKRVQKDVWYVSNAGASVLCVFCCPQLFHCRATV